MRRLASPPPATLAANACISATVRKVDPLDVGSQGQRGRCLTRDADGVVLAEPGRIGRREDRLEEFETGRIAPARCGERVVAVTGDAAVAVDRQPERMPGSEHPVEAQLGHRKRLDAVRIAAAGQPHLVADDLGAAVGAEPFEPAVEPVAEQHHPRRIGRRYQRVLRQCSGDARHGLSFEPVAELKVTRRGVRGDGGEQGDSKRRRHGTNETHGLACRGGNASS